MMKALLVLLLVFAAQASSAEKKAKDTKGLLPELKIDGQSEEVNQKKALQSELMITRAENAAINSLIKIIKASKGKPNEAELWNRLAEMYMRRAKSGRYFDLQRQDTGGIAFVPPEVTDESAIKSLKLAIQIYTKIEKQFPKFSEMDAVLFNNGFASQQIGLKKNASQLYQAVLEKYPRSPLVPDALLALGEMSYEAQKFAVALDYFIKMEKYPRSRVFSYGMYKAAWTLYNLRQNEEAIQKLIEVVKHHDPTKTEAKKVNHNLRSESLRDLALFFGESHKAEEAFSFFSKIATPEEVGEVLISMAKLYDSHSRQKEMQVFLSEFIKKMPLSQNRIKAQILIIEGHETLKNRKQVITELKETAKVCEVKSKWRLANPVLAEEACDIEFSKTAVAMAGKWWEIWQKNKNNVEFSDLTKQVFQIHLDREDTTKPDTKSRYAYGELLFQLKEYRAASFEYQKVSELSTDVTVRHDADYAALVSLQKAQESKKESTDNQELLRLSQRYLEQNPKGTYTAAVKFKIGFIAYEQGQFEEAEKWLKPLALNSTELEIKRKSEDLVLDIYNSRKDYKELKDFSKNLIDQNPEEQRRASLAKIMTEARYAEIQDLVVTNDKIQAASELASFANDNPSSPLAMNAHWQAISLYNSNGKIVQGAELSLDFAKKYPNEKKSLQALKDASKTYLELGLLNAAADIMILLAAKDPESASSYLEASAEIYILEGKQSEARKKLFKILDKAKKDDQTRIIGKLMGSFKGDEADKDFKSLRAKILDESIEPYASQIKLSKVEELFATKKLTEAFNAAKPLVGSSGKIDDDVRAKARLIQARILEAEFLGQSTKTNLERLSLVVSLKTEKLDKAQTAYLSAAKIAKDPNTKLAALQGLNRIYTNYVETVASPVIKDHLQDEEQKALLAELEKLTQPILKKKIETDEQLQTLAKETSAIDEEGTSFANLSVDKTYQPKLRSLTAQEMPIFVPNYTADIRRSSAVSESKLDKCLKQKLADLEMGDLRKHITSCFYKKNFAEVEAGVTELSRREPNSPLVTYYLSLVSEANKQLDKAIYLIDIALKKGTDVAFLYYQKGRLLTEAKDQAGANSQFLKASSLGFSTKEIHLIHGLVAYARGDYWTTTEELSKLDSKTIASRGLHTILSECLAQKGEFEKALSYAEENMKISSRPDELWLQVARIHETYRFDTTKAISAYEAALKVAKQAEMAEWIQRKLDFLKTKHNVTVLNPLHVNSKDADGGL